MKVITLEPSSLSQKNERRQLNDAEG